MKATDGTAFVNIYWLRTSKTFGEYFDDELAKGVYCFSDGVYIMDFVFDRYLENSIKTHTHEGRGKRTRISVRKDTSLCVDFKTFIRDSYSKAELFLVIANSICQIRDVPTSMIATVKKKVISNDFREDFMPCHQEEADTTLLLTIFYVFSKSGKPRQIVDDSSR